MFIFKSVVGKLWITIIGLVFVVLSILGIFLVNFIGEYFYLAKDQKESLTKLARDYSTQASLYREYPNFYTLSNTLLANQDTRLIVLDQDLREISNEVEITGNLVNFQAIDFFTFTELQLTRNGQEIVSQIPKNDDILSHKVSGYLAVVVPLRDQNQQIIGALVLYQSMQSLETIQSYVIRLFIYVSMIGFAMTTIFAFFLFSRITRPLQQLKKAAYLISQKEYDTKVPVLTKDEIGELATTFNQMVEELQSNIHALSQEKEHLSSVLRSMTDAVISCDAQGNVILSNPQGEKMVQEWGNLDWTEPIDTIESRNKPFVQAPTNTIPKPLLPLFESVVVNSREASMNIHVQNGVWSVAMTPLYAQSQVRGAVAVLRDVTEQFRLDKLRKDFVANVSHELSTPLSMLQGYSEALMDDIVNTPEERGEVVQVIHDETLRMGRLVRDLLDLARMEAAQLELNFQKVDMHVLIKRTYRKFLVLAKEKGIHLTYEEPTDAIILDYADEDRLEQVLTNLLDNAFRHSAEGNAIHITSNKTLMDKKEAIQVKIIDQGSGIPTDDLPYIFERFYKADKARTRGTHGGTGLGLAIVKNIIEAHHGLVQVQSQIGKGTTFTLLIPVHVMKHKQKAHHAK